MWANGEERKNRVNKEGGEAYTNPAFRGKTLDSLREILAGKRKRRGGRMVSLEKRRGARAMCETLLTNKAGYVAGAKKTGRSRRRSWEPQR